MTDRPKLDAPLADGDAVGRISALEEEVARLRARLAEQDDSETSPDDSEPAASTGAAALLPSRSRAITIALLLALVALAGILAVTYALSSVIEPFSRKAASAIVPWEPDPKAAPRENESPSRAAPPAEIAPRAAPEEGSGPAKADPALRAPGL